MFCHFLPLMVMLFILKYLFPWATRAILLQNNISNFFSFFVVLLVQKHKNFCTSLITFESWQTWKLLSTLIKNWIDTIWLNKLCLCCEKNKKLSKLDQLFAEMLLLYRVFLRDVTSAACDAISSMIWCLPWLSIQKVS